MILFLPVSRGGHDCEGYFFKEACRAAEREERERLKRLLQRVKAPPSSRLIYHAARLRPAELTAHRQHQGVRFVLDVVEPIASRRHGDAEQIAVVGRLVSAHPPRVDLIAAERVDLHHLAVQPICYQEMPVGRRGNRKQPLRHAVPGDRPADGRTVIAPRRR